MIVQLFLIFLRLGSTSFGGPIANIGHFREEFVERRQWFQEATYAELVALSQILPGPASTKIAIALGLLKAGHWGALASCIGFVLPSSLLMVLFAFSISHTSFLSYPGWIQVTKTVAVAVVVQAVLSMGKRLCSNQVLLCFAAIAACLALILPSPTAQIVGILSGGLLGKFFLKENHLLLPAPICIPIHRHSGSIALFLFFTLLLVLPLLANFAQRHDIQVFEDFFRTGALMFGGAHIILPLLQSIVVPSGMISNDLFLAGYGISQAIPGPFLAFSAYIGALSNIPPNGWSGAYLCLIAIYLPSYLLIIGVLPFWGKIRSYHWMKPVMEGLNASVVGVLGAALYNPLFKNAVHNLKDACFVLVAFLLLAILRWPAWLVVILGVFFGAAEDILAYFTST